VLVFRFVSYIEWWNLSLVYLQEFRQIEISFRKSGRNI